MREVTLDVDWNVNFLPAVNATLNGLTAVALLFSLYFVKQGEFVKHRNANATALGLSVLFLLCYVAYHFTTPEVLYGDADQNGVLSEAERLAVSGSRPWYLVILISHITPGRHPFALHFVNYCKSDYRKVDAAPQDGPLGLAAVALCSHHRSGRIPHAPHVLSLNQP